MFTSSISNILVFIIFNIYKLFIYFKFIIYSLWLFLNNEMKIESTEMRI